MKLTFSSLGGRLSERRYRLAAAILSGLLLHFVVNLRPWWPLAWIAPIPILLAAFYASALEAMLLTFLAASIALSSLFIYYRSVMPGWQLPVLLLLLQAILWTGIVRITRRFVVASAGWWIVFVYPLLWAAFDTLISALSPHASWGSLAYSQGDALRVLQVASFAGTPGVVFVLCLFPSVIAVAFYRGRDIAWPTIAYGFPAILLASVLFYGNSRLHQKTDTARLAVGLVAIDDYVGPRVPQAMVDGVWDSYDSAITRLAAQGAKLVLLPEKIEVLDAVPAEQRLGLLAAAARNNGVFLAAGTGHRQNSDPNKIARNRLWLFDPSGELVKTYDKQHLVPGLETEFTPGQDFVVQTIGSSRYGLAICKDMHFPSLGREYGRLQVDAMLVPAWDFERDDWMAARITALRGIESGFSVIRASREGLLTVSDRFGRVIGEKHSSALPGASLFVSAPIGHAALTPYAKFGDVFGWACVATAIAVRVFAKRLLRTNG